MILNILTLKEFLKQKNYKIKICIYLPPQIQRTLRRHANFVICPFESIAQRGVLFVDLRKRSLIN